LSLSRDRRLFAHFYLFFEQAKKRPRNQFGVHGERTRARRERRRGIFHSREAELAALLLSDERVREYSANASIVSRWTIDNDIGHLSAPLSPRLFYRVSALSRSSDARRDTTRQILHFVLDPLCVALDDASSSNLIFGNREARTLRPKRTISRRNRLASSSPARLMDFCFRRRRCNADAESKQQCIGIGNISVTLNIRQNEPR